MPTRSILKRSLFLGLVAFAFNSIIYFGFTSSYSRWLYSETTYQGQYNQSVYKYRIIGKEAVLKLYHVLKQKYPQKEQLDPNSPVKTMDPAGSQNFYNAYYLVNTFALIICAFLLAFLVELPVMGISEKEKYLIPFTIICTLVISGFVIVPYDIIANAFTILFAISAVRYFMNKNSIWLVISCVLLVLSTLNRETSALSISFFASICLIKWGMKKTSFTLIGLLIGCWLVTYLGIRIILGFEENSMIGYNFLIHNFTHKLNLLGILIWILLGWFTLIVSNDRLNQKLVLLFHLLCLPYIASCLFGGIMFEIRLYVPIFISSMILSKLSSSFIKENKIIQG